MAEGQRMIDLPSDVMTNISSFLLGTPQQIKLKYSSKFKQIQQKYKLQIFEKDELCWILKSIPQGELTKKTEYGYYIRNYNKAIKSFHQALRIIRGQFDKLFSLIPHNGETELYIFLNYYNIGNGIESGDVCLGFDSSVLNNKTEFYRILTQKTDKRYVIESNSIMFDTDLLKVHSIYFSFEHKTPYRT